MVAHTFNPSTCEFEARLVYRASSRIDSQSYAKNPVTKKQKQKQKKEVGPSGTGLYSQLLLVLREFKASETPLQNEK